MYFSSPQVVLTEVGEVERDLKAADQHPQWSSVTGSPAKMFDLLSTRDSHSSEDSEMVKWGSAEKSISHTFDTSASHIKWTSSSTGL